MMLGLLIFRTESCCWHVHDEDLGCWLDRPETFILAGTEYGRILQWLAISIYTRSGIRRRGLAISGYGYVDHIRAFLILELIEILRTKLFVTTSTILRVRPICTRPKHALKRWMLIVEIAPTLATAFITGQCPQQDELYSLASDAYLPRSSDTCSSRRICCECHISNSCNW